MALYLSRPKRRSLTNPSLIHLFSTSSSSPPPNDPDAKTNFNINRNDGVSGHSSISSFVSEVKASLKHRQETTATPFSRKSVNPTVPSSNPASLEEIRKNLSEFSRRAAGPPVNESSSAPSPGSPAISFHELYKRNVMQKAGESNVNADVSGPGAVGGGKLSLDAIRERMRQMRSNTAVNAEKRGGVQPLSLSRFKDNLRMKPSYGDLGSKVIGGTSAELPISVFGRREMKGDEEKSDQSSMKTEFLKFYSPVQLGEKLRMLRPEKKQGNWFSLQELNERLVRLREMDEKESESRIGGIHFQDLRESLVRLQMADEEKQKRSSIHRLNILGELGGTPDFMKYPPKEQLIEKYFHPDNLSSAEKMKIELTKVRDEFKMSESDCGSARVQVAQLTTKIKHLASVLHKKDKHSRKGLQAMVQKRKKLLKYLRRTDWDSYCFVLGRLGLRDNPDYKH
ncbi:hypothetical protein SLE2022_381070 [Rubroshorea leprosula]